jgi:hypothetical protein
MFGDDVIPVSAGGAFTAAGRIVNKHPNAMEDTALTRPITDCL